jgi:hypothetical protein
MRSAAIMPARLLRGAGSLSDDLAQALVFNLAPDASARGAYRFWRKKRLWSADQSSSPKTS